jgi:anti-sigma factor RsiW
MSSLNDEDRANLTAYLDGELDEEAAQTLEAKISQDPAARAEVEELKRAWSMLDYLPRPSPSTTFTHRTMERLSLEGRAAETGKMPAATRPWGRWLGWTAACVLAGAVGYFGSGRLFAPQPTTEADEPLVEQLHVIEKWRTYEFVDDLDFLKALEHPDLFGDEPGS